MTPIFPLLSNHPIVTNHIKHNHTLHQTTRAKEMPSIALIIKSARHECIFVNYRETQLFRENVTNHRTISTHFISLKLLCALPYHTTGIHVKPVGWHARYLWVFYRPVVIFGLAEAPERIGVVFICSMSQAVVRYNDLWQGWLTH